MRLTTKGRFAVTAMMDLAMREGAGPVALASISERQKISLSYLEQLFGRLRREGLVTSVRGPGGGYRLGKALEGMSVAEIILAVDEPIDTTGCAGQENCKDDNGKCLTHDLWVALNQKIFDYLGSVTLGQLVTKQKNATLGVVEIKDRRPNRQEGVSA